MLKKVIRLMKNKLGGIMTEFAALRPETYSYLMDDESAVRKEKGIKKYLIKRKRKCNDYKHCLLNNEFILKSQQIYKSERHGVYTDEINKVA